MRRCWTSPPSRPGNPGDRPARLRSRPSPSGIGIARGQVLGAGWKIDSLDADLRSLAPAKPLRAHLRGRYATAMACAAPIDVHATLTKPASGAGVGDCRTKSHWKARSGACLRKSPCPQNCDLENGLGLQRAVLAREIALCFRQDFPAVLTGHCRAAAVRRSGLEPAARRLGIARAGSDAHAGCRRCILVGRRHAHRSGRRPRRLAFRMAGVATAAGAIDLAAAIRRWPTTVPATCRVSQR